MTSVAEKLSSEDRSQILERYVITATHSGWRVVSQTSTQAQLVKGKPTNHLLHLILSLVTLGLWVPVWIGVAIFAGQKQRFCSVDEYGRVTTS